MSSKVLPIALGAVIAGIVSMYLLQTKEGTNDTTATTLSPVRSPPSDGDIYDSSLPEEDSEFGAIRLLRKQPQGAINEHCTATTDQEKKRHEPRCLKHFKAAAESCQRLIVDDFASGQEIALIRSLAEKLMMRGGGGAGGVTLVDAAHGIVSVGEHFGSLYAMLKTELQKISAGKIRLSLQTQVQPIEVDAYRNVTARIHAFLTRRFLASDETGISHLKMAKPAFISRIDDKPAKTPNDEYWHAHIDTDQYGSFDLTTLLYLTSYAGEDPSSIRTAKQGEDWFTGGTFDFVNSGADEEVSDVLAVPPRAGRLLVFTSGPEHPHKVAKVTKGTRFAMTTAFTCDPEAKSSDVHGEDFLGNLDGYVQRSGA